MKRLFAFLLAMIVCIGLSACSVIDRSGRDGQSWTATDSTNVYFLSAAEKVARTQLSIGNGNDALYINMVKNEKEGGQFFIRNDISALEDVCAYVSDLTSLDGHVISSKEYSRIGAEGTTGNYVMIFREHYSKIDHVPDTPAYYMPDALVPLYSDNNSVQIAQGDNQGFYISVKTTAADPAGLYTGKVVLTHSSGTVEIPVYVTVYDVALPDVSYSKAMVLGWNIADAYEDVGIDYIQAKEMLMYFLLDNRMNIDWLPGSQGTWLSEYCDTVKKYGTDPRVQVFHMPFFGEVKNDRYYVNAEKTKTWRAQMAQLGVLDKCYYYEFDEIGTPDKYALASQMHQALMEIDPGIKSLITLFSGTSEMYGNLSVWCTGRKGTTQTYIDRIYGSGTKEVWWYGTEERQIGLNNLTQAKNLFWTQHALGIVGYLDWAADCYSYFNPEDGYYGLFNCWDNVYQSDDYAAYGGDSFIVYPGKEGDGIVNRNLIVSSLRFEAIRDGIEDYDLLTIRKQQIQRKLDQKGITALTAADFMGIYYDGMNNSVNLNTNTIYPEAVRYEKLRERLIKDIVLDSDTVIGITEGESFMQRCVYALSDTPVTVCGIPAVYEDGVWTADVFCRSVETPIEVSTAAESMVYYVYPLIVTETENILDAKTQGQPFVQQLDSDAVVYQNDRIYFDASTEDFDVSSAQWPGTKDWSEYQYLAVNVKNEGDNPIDELSVMLYTSRDSAILQLDSPILPGQTRTLYFDYREGGKLSERGLKEMAGLLINSPQSAQISLGYISLCNIQ